jgi:hypothetical protein
MAAAGPRGRWCRRGEPEDGERKGGRLPLVPEITSARRGPCSMNAGAYIYCRYPKFRKGRCKLGEKISERERKQKFEHH